MSECEGVILVSLAIDINVFIIFREPCQQRMCMDLAFFCLIRWCDGGKILVSIPHTAFSFFVSSCFIRFKIHLAD